jgi:hypothetical protein
MLPLFDGSRTTLINVSSWKNISQIYHLIIKLHQNILRNTTQVIIRHRVKILFSVISSPITLERQKWKSSKVFFRMFWNFISSLPVKRGGSLSFLTIFTFAVPELLDLIWRKIGCLCVVLLFSISAFVYRKY